MPNPDAAAPARNPFFPDVTQPLRFPRDLLRVLYWAYFRPFTLARYLEQRDVSLESSLWMLWRHRREYPELRDLVYLTLFHILVTPWLALPLAGLRAWLGVPVNWDGVLRGVLGGVLTGVLTGMLVGVLGGVLGGGLMGVLWGRLWGVLFSGLVGVLWGVLEGVLWGGLLGVLWGGLVGVLWGVSEGMLVGLASVLAALVGTLRLHDWVLFFLPLQAWFWAWVDRQGRRLAWSPPFWHEVIVLPLPGVEAHVYRAARHDRALGRHAIAYLAAYRYPWARKVARRVALRLFLDDMAQARTLDALAALAQTVESRLATGDEREALGELFERVTFLASKVRAGLESGALINRVTRWDEALQAARTWHDALMLHGHPLATALIPILENWIALLEAALEQARKQDFIFNPYVPATPLATGSATFKGRRDVMQRLEAEFAAFQTQRPALLLFGGRRMGKTSLLKQLPVRLGAEVVPLVLDLQGLGTVESSAAFWGRLVAEARKVARDARGMSFPAVDEAALARDPFDTFLRWLDAVERAAPQHYFLLALDEYESLETAIREGRLDLRVLDVFRHILQHRSRWLVLFSGVYTFEDLPVHWSDKFINVRRLLVGPLEEDAARELIVRPVLDFEQQVHYPPEAVERLLYETGRQPNWLQAALHELIQRLNRERRREVTLDDVAWALDQVPRRLGGDFRHLWETALPFPARARAPEVLAGYQRILVTIAEAPGISAAALRQRLPQAAQGLVTRTLRFFTARQMLLRDRAGGYRWAFPLLARWLREQATEMGMMD